MERVYHVGGVTCSGCVATIERILSNSQVETFEFEPESLILTVSGSEAAVEDAIQQIRKHGYDVKASGGSSSNVWLLVTLPLMLVLNLAHFGVVHVSMLWQFVISLPIIAALFPRVLNRAFSQRTISLEFFVSLSVSAGIVSTVYAVMAHDHTLFFAETYSTILYIITLGGFVERKAFAKFQSLFPKASAIFNKSYKVKVAKIGGSAVVEIPVSQIKELNNVLLARGERVPVDITVLEGSCWVDESVVTGQFHPTFKKSGDTVLAGSLVLEGSIVGQANSNFFNSSFRKILGSLKAPHNVNLVNPLSQVLTYFVPLVALIAVITASIMIYLGRVDEAMTRSLAVLVIACPCAIGIALPLALSVCGLRALSLGAVIKNSEAILALGKAQSFLLDKTGTLTEESYTVDKIELHNQEARDRLFSAQAVSNHPLAKPVVESLGSAKSFYTVIDSKVESNRVIFTFDDGEVMVVEKQDKLKFNVYLRGVLVGAYSLRERKREQLAEFLRFLRRSFSAVRVLSGDAADSEFRSFLEQLRIDHEFALRPDEKTKIVQLSPKPVVFVGDGLNDAGAIEAADCGISFSYSTSVIQDKADIVLTNHKLTVIVNIIRLARFTRRVIWQNLFWGSLYNIIAIPLAAFGYVYPTVGAFGMVLSDLVVVFNSLRISRFRPEGDPAV